jgi:hypothetical protein
MGFRDRIMAWLDRGEPRVLDPESVVQVAEVMLHDGPLLLAALEREGIRAHGFQAYDYISEASNRMRIVVQAKDAQLATDLIESVDVQIKRPIL